MSVAAYFLIIAAVANIILIIHILSNTMLNKTERLWFSVVAGLYSLIDLLELVCGSSAFAVSNYGFFAFLLMLEFIISPLSAPFKCLAYGRRKTGVAALIVCGAAAVIEIIAFFTGKLFYLDEAGKYTEGSLMLIITIISLLYTLFDIVVLGLVGRKFRIKDRGTLIGIWALIIIFVIARFFTDSSSVTLPCATISLMLIYLYYYSLKQQELQNLLQEVSMESIQAVVDAIDAKDEYTKGHSSRVAEYSKALAEKLGYDGDKLYRLYYAASMHDVGKIGIPDSVLNKAGRLENIEFDMMKEHTQRGGEITKRISLLPEAYAAARNHHERFDGRGYPDGLSGKDIPEVARIIAVADMYDAMNSDRIYRKALPKDVIRSEMLKGSGTQIDPDYVKVFVDMIDSGELDYIGDAARADMKPQTVDDDFTSFTRDILEFFLLKHEYTGQWDPTFEKWDMLKNYIGKITEKYNVAFELAVVSIKPADDRTVTEEQQEKAIDVMLTTAGKMMNDGDVCARISLHQIAMVFRKDSEKDLSTTMKDILIYYYKIFESQPFSIGYYVIDN